MSRKVRRVGYSLSPQRKKLSLYELKIILRGADHLIMRGGRNLLAKILKGSKDKKVKELKLNRSPVYGVFKQFTLPEIAAKIDRAVSDGYLDIEYDYRLPLLVFTDKGWEIEMDTYTDELIKDFDKMVASGQTSFDMSYLKDRNRPMILLLLDKVAATKDPKYIPLLKAWAQVDYKKVKKKINWVISQLLS